MVDDNMDNTEESEAVTEIAAESKSAEPQWKPLSAKQRRVLGTLMEKSKTTPDAYPMTYAGLTTGCNQKSNRAPISNYTAEQIETIVDELRTLGAVTIVQGSGRVTKVRHYAYNWLAINKVEAAIMTELLLRGEQTLGELRTRASRMEPINDLNELNQLFNDLKRRHLVVELTPPGRGQMVSHNLYPEWELEQLRKAVAAGMTAAGTSESDDDSPRSSSGATSSSSITGMQRLEQELVALRQTVSDLTGRLEHLEKELGVQR